MAQALKMLEEAEETALAVRYRNSTIASNYSTPEKIRGNLLEIKDGIGDTCVTLILLAEMYGMTLEECLTHALEIIEKRTGKMKNGTFVKDCE